MGANTNTNNYLIILLIVWVACTMSLFFIDHKESINVLQSKPTGVYQLKGDSRVFKLKEINSYREFYETTIEVDGGTVTIRSLDQYELGEQEIRGGLIEMSKISNKARQLMIDYFILTLLIAIITFYLVYKGFKEDSGKKDGRLLLLSLATAALLSIFNGVALTLFIYAGYVL